MLMTANRYRKYDWTVWTNGKEHTATWGEDFTCGISSFVTLLHQRARSQSGISHVATSTEGLTVTFQFYHEELTNV